MSKTICERFVCPTKEACDAYETSHYKPPHSRSRPCDFEKAKGCGEGTCLRCILTETCEVVFGKYPTPMDIHRLVCNPGHTMGCKNKTEKDCGHYPPFSFAFCKIFEKNCKDRFKVPEAVVMEDGEKGLKFLTFVVPKAVIDDYIRALSVKLRRIQRVGFVDSRIQLRPLSVIIDGDREIHNLHKVVMRYFPGDPGNVSVVPSAFRYAVQGYVEDELRRFGCIP